MSKETAKEYFVKGCNEYLRLFCEKHDFDYEDAKDSWVGGSVGEITECGDYYVSMQTIITDIEMDAPKDEFLKWRIWRGKQEIQGAIAEALEEARKDGSR